MPRSKKKLIDRNASNAFTFRLVHRSQHDPRAADPEASKYVLHPVNMGAAASNMTLDPDELFGATASASAANAADSGGSSTPLSTSANGTAEKTKQKKKKGSGGDAASASAAEPGAELLRYGIYYDDGYDYMQHLREPGGANTEHVDADAAQMRKLALQANKEARLERLNLPEDVFPSAVEEKIGLLNRAAPNSDPRIDWDPDVVAALDSDGEGDGEYDDPNGEAWLPDDFVTMANSNDPSVSWGGDDDGEADEMTEEDHWRSIGHGGLLRGWRPPMDGVGSADEEGDEDDDDDDTVAAASEGGPRSVGDGTDDEDDEDDDAGSAATSRFTEYSMTSSILTRTDIQQRQDEHFEELFAQYDEDQMGGLDDEAEEGDVIGEEDISKYTHVLDDFLSKTAGDRGYYFKGGSGTLVEKLAAAKLSAPGEATTREILDAVIAVNQDQAAADSTTAAKQQSRDPLMAALEGDDDPEAAGSADDAEDTEEQMMIAVPYPDKRDRQWDCESILSTKSTLYNHPATIELAKKKRKGKKKPTDSGKIELDPRGIPVEGLRDRRPVEDGAESDSGSDDAVEGGAEGNLDFALFKRTKNETPEERHARKQAIKELKRERREAKKANKLAFKREEQRQFKVRYNAEHHEGMKLLK